MAALAATDGKPIYCAADAHQRPRRGWLGLAMPVPGRIRARLQRQCEHQGNAEVSLRPRSPFAGRRGVLCRTQQALEPIRSGHLQDRAQSPLG